LQVANTFMHSREADILQDYLESRAAKMDNWVIIFSDLIILEVALRGEVALFVIMIRRKSFKLIQLTPWWIDKAYLESRTPLPIVSNPGVSFPKWNYCDLDGQIDAAAKVAQSALIFYKMIQNNKLPQEKMGDELLDMGQYKNLFGTTRIPSLNKDKIKYGYQCETPSEHFIVMRNGHIFRIPAFDSNGNVLSLDQLKNEIKSCVIPSSEIVNEHPLGVVTAEHRDKWADLYSKLQDSNLESLKSVEDSLFVLCIDKKMDDIVGVTPADLQSLECLHGGGCNNNSHNRWFDKTLQFIIGTDGYCGVNYEHTPVEGPAVASLMEFICDQLYVSSSHSIFHYWTDKMDHSYIQLSMQLAYYRIHHKQPSTYETATLRKYLNGRTDTIRLPSVESLIFTSAMIDADDDKKKPDDNDLMHMLKYAVQKHKHYTVQAMNGNGMDRHLLGIELAASDLNMPLPKIFSTDAYKKMMHFNLSTSQVPTRNLITMCYGPSSPDCYASCYNPQDEQIHFSICTFKSCPTTSSYRFARELEHSLNDMHRVVQHSESIPRFRS
uniref:Carn_acyltransf domain-containing protein n=1 Tax=Anisakis simplex TaxID=6269 RepID=A0A0M3K2Q8_ANISI